MNDLSASFSVQRRQLRTEEGRGQEENNKKDRKAEKGKNNSYQRATLSNSGPTVVASPLMTCAVTVYVRMSTCSFHFCSAETPCMSPESTRYWA